MHTAIETKPAGQAMFLSQPLNLIASLNTLLGAGTLVSKQDPTCGGEMLNGASFYDYYTTSDARYLPIGSLEPNFAAGLL